jgi:hypothetical protein
MTCQEETFLEISQINDCPKCKGEVTFMYGLGGANGMGAYWVCLDCDWVSTSPQETVCFPHGLVNSKTES